MTQDWTIILRTDWQTGLGLGRTGRRENGCIRQKDWDRTGPRTGPGMEYWGHQTGAHPIRTGQLNGTDSPSPAPKLDWDPMQDYAHCLVVHTDTAAELRTLHRRNGPVALFYQPIQISIASRNMDHFCFFTADHDHFHHPALGVFFK